MRDVPTREDVEIAYAEKRQADVLIEKLSRELSWLGREYDELEKKYEKLEEANARQAEMLKKK